MGFYTNLILAYFCYFLSNSWNIEFMMLTIDLFYKLLEVHLLQLLDGLQLDRLGRILQVAVQNKHLLLIHKIWLFQTILLKRKKWWTIPKTKKVSLWRSIWSVSQLVEKSILMLTTATISFQLPSINSFEDFLQVNKALKHSFLLSWFFMHI